MNDNQGMRLVAPRITPVLDPGFRPAVLANRAWREMVRQSGVGVPVALALEQADGSVFHFQTEVMPTGHHQAAGNLFHVERLVKALLWLWGGFRIHVQGPAEIAAGLQRHYQEQAQGKFDSEIIGRRIYDHPIEIVPANKLPPARANSMPLGRNLDGCRIGFDLGGSDRKVAAVIDGRAVFSEEIVWDPVKQTDPQYHFDGIMDSLRRAAEHLPRIDAIGGSAAGVYVNNRVKVASLFRAVPPDLFQSRVREIFLEVQRAWGGIPLEVVNDGEVTALAGSMSLGANGVLGIALGTSMAGGYVNREGNITSWLNEVAFMPVDYRPAAPVDEWSGDLGCGVQFFSQQAVGRLLAVAGLALDPGLPLPEKLKEVQRLMLAGDFRAEKIYATIGTCLGYALAHYAEFYDFSHLLILGRVTSGPGGDVIIAGAREVLRREFPELAEQIAFHIPDEKDKRHGQAIAAASLPKLRT